MQPKGVLQVRLRPAEHLVDSDASAARVGHFHFGTLVVLRFDLGDDNVSRCETFAAPAQMNP